jgi:hypothetical protein
LKKILISLSVIFGLTPAFAQDDFFDYYESKTLKYENDVYLPFIKSVRLFPTGSPQAHPIVKLGAKPLQLLFDDLTAVFQNYSYTIVHCNADWTPSDLLKAEYIDGFQDYFIDRHEFAFNTFVPYVSYRLTIPNQHMRITKSGNYLLIVYEDNNPEHLVLTRRFMVYEEFVNVGVEPKRATLAALMDTHQEINFTINHSGYTIPDPERDLKVSVLQNGRWDNAIMNLRPQFIGNNQLIYNYDQENTFAGGMEFRFFDTKSFQTLTMNVRNIKQDSVWVVYLVPMARRNTQRYSVQPDINGKYVIRRSFSQNPEIEADYCWVDFLLLSDEIFQNESVYVFGGLSDWQIRPEFQLKFNYKLKGYQGKILLKQGYYDFKYVLVPDGTKRADEGAIEGDHWETENDYHILVYNREIGIRYDRLIGFAQVNYQGL